jgi:hypothetical protein
MTLAPVSSLTFQPACHLPAGERDRAQPLLDPPLWRAGLGGHVATTPADTALRAPPISKTLQIADSACPILVEAILARPLRSP